MVRITGIEIEGLTPYALTVIAPFEGTVRISAAESARNAASEPSGARDIKAAESGVAEERERERE